MGETFVDLGELETTEESCGLLEEKLDLESIQGELEKDSFGRNLLEAESRVLCIREEDGNTKFFLRMANSHKRFNFIDRLIVDKETSSDLEAITECISCFYRQLYYDRPDLDDVDFSRISEENALWLDRPFDEEEVFRMINGFNSDKSPGPDGFSMAFF